MAINITPLVINSEDFTIGKKTYTVNYTQELDDQFSDMILKTGNLLHDIESADYDDDMPLDEQRKVVKDGYAEVAKISKEYLAAALGEKHADEVVSYAGNRTVTLAKIARTIYEAGQDDEELREKYGSNRSERRGKKG